MRHGSPIVSKNFRLGPSLRFKPSDVGQPTTPNFHIIFQLPHHITDNSLRLWFVCLNWLTAPDGRRPERDKVPQLVRFRRSDPMLCIGWICRMSASGVIDQRAITSEYAVTQDLPTSGRRDSQFYGVSSLRPRWIGFRVPTILELSVFILYDGIRKDLFAIACGKRPKLICGSSATSSSGRQANACAITSLCRCPPVN
jgi:hypothetical protein